jgi:aspartyl/asparaginyl beta-hydroxylase (cupin superfamily)
MNNFAKLAEGLDVAPALAELAAQPDYLWIQINNDDLLYIQLLTGTGERQLEAELPAIWRLIDGVLALAAAEHGDRGALSYCRIGLMPPGSGLPPHYGGIDGIGARRYQLALVSEPGVILEVGGEAKWPRAGEAWQIDASRTHRVSNDSPVDRITILFDTQV